MIDPERHYTEVDLPFYERTVKPLIPPEILDFHAHTWIREQFRMVPWKERALGGRYMVTEEDYSVEALLADGRRMFPGKGYKAVVFGNPTPAVDVVKTNDYIAGAGKNPDLFPLMIAGRGLEKRERVEQRILEERIYGFKVFLSWFGDDYGSVKVRDMIGPAEMALAEEYRLVVLLHVPGGERLADPEVQDGVRALAGEYPNARIVLAHCGRCYHPDQMKRAIGSVADLANVYLDSSMVMDPLVIQIALESIGSKRLLFGTDLPVAGMRGRRVYAMDHWVDLVLPGPAESAYRVQSADIRATFMVYEIILAIVRAARQIGLAGSDLSAIFHDNGMELLERARNREGPRE
jgi:hypothetical protein